MSTIIELPNLEYTQDFINMVKVLLDSRISEKETAQGIKDNAKKVRDNAQLAIDQQDIIIAEKDVHIAGLSSLIDQATDGMD